MIRQGFVLLCMVFLTSFSKKLYAQNFQLTHSVTGTLGVEYKGDLNISSTLGEAIVWTSSSSNYTLTQGFHQPSIVAVVPLDITLTNATCIFREDGYAVLNVKNGGVGYAVQWSDNGGQADTSGFYAPGSYWVTVRDYYDRQAYAEFKIDYQLNKDCDFKIYSGLTPNNDGNNDVWIIDGISDFSEVMVTIFDRWGNRVWSGENYDNTTVVWSGESENGITLPDGTYFYTVQILDNDQKYQGWVHLNH